MKPGVLLLEVGPWLGTSLINREEAHFSEHEYRSEMVKGIWVGPECQIRALEIPPPAGQDRCGDFAGLSLQLEVRWHHWDPGKDARAGNQSQGWLGLRSAPRLSRLLCLRPASHPGRSGGSWHIPSPLCPRLFSSPLLLSFRGRWQRVGSSS